MTARKIIVVSYDTQWQIDFERIKCELEKALDGLTIGIEHVGSTAVPGLSAKPIIDIDVVIPDYSVFQTVIEKLERQGYIYEGTLGIKDREAFAYEGKKHLKEHHLYVCPQNSAELKRHITFRDFLRSNEGAKLKYSKVKEEGAILFPYDINSYITYKTSCIKELYKQCGLEI